MALLKTGSSSVGPIVKEAKVAYSNIYDILDRLLEKGLISFILKEKTKYFQAVPPSRLKEYLEKKEKELEKEKEIFNRILPELEKIQNQESKTEAEIFIGLKGIKTAYYKMLEANNKKEEWLFLYIDEGQTTDEFYASMYPIFKKIPSKGIANKKYKKSEFIDRTNFKMKYVDFPIPGTIDIYKNKVLFISWKPVPTGILISSDDITNKFKGYFYSIWKR